tara:strand:+ start:320 stop:691 length:372 start_codon:yes stop_codon:yes gene_type:complete
METKLKRNLAVQVIKDHNISEIEIHYSGGGDDGCIDQIKYHDNKKEDVVIKMQKEIEVEFDDLLYNLLNAHIEWDWINNEGGFGTMTINCKVEPWDIEIDHGQNVIEDHHYDDIKFNIDPRNY